MGKQNAKAGSFQLAQQVAQQQATEQAKQTQESTTPAVKQDGVSDEAKKDVVEQGAGEQSQEDTQESNQEGAEGTATGSQEPTDIITIPITPVAPAAAPVVQKAIVVEKSQPVPANATLTEKLASILKDVPPAHQIDINRVLTYLERMTPKRPIDTKTGVAEQVALYRSIQNIINRQEDYFTQLFSALLFIFKSEAKGALGDRYRNRFMDNVTLPAGDRKAFAHIGHALFLLADPQSRQLALRQLNLEKTLENGLTAAGQARVLHYFGV